MNDQLTRAVIQRMHLREVAIAPHYTGVAADLQMMSAADPKAANEQALARRTELCGSYGLDVSGPQTKPFAFSQGVAIIPVHGTLINRFGQSWGYVTGYNFIRAQTAAAGLDPDVQVIVYDHNSYGGEAAGCFECAAEIPALANGKPTIAVIDSNCYSASYALASACDHISLTPSGGAGSIGVVAMHVSMQKALENWGIEVTFIHSGDHKVDGNPYENLPDSVKKDIQAGVDKSRQAFAQLVADGRGLDLKAVMDTEARIYRADDAFKLGLIDAVATPSEAVRAFLSGLSGSQSQPPKGKSMSMNTQEPGGVTQAAADQAAAKAAADARTAERARIQGIQSCEEAKGREALANHLALNTEMSVDAAKGILAAAPKTEPKATPAEPAKGANNGFAAAMNNSQHPNVGADGGNGGAAPGGEEPAHMRILRAQEAATGLKLVKSA